MAKVIITIEDIGQGKVKFASSPSFEMMCKMTVSGEELTSAHGYALKAINVMYKAAKERQSSKIDIVIPRVFRT